MSDRLAVVLWWFIELYSWSRFFLPTDERTNEGVPRGPRGPKKHPVSLSSVRVQGWRFSNFVVHDAAAAAAALLLKQRVFSPSGNQPSLSLSRIEATQCVTHSPNVPNLKRERLWKHIDVAENWEPKQSKWPNQTEWLDSICNSCDVSRQKKQELPQIKPNFSYSSQVSRAGPTNW